MAAHPVRRNVNPGSMSRQDPLEGPVSEAFHGVALLGPGVPAVVARRVEPVLLGIPPEMVAREQVAILMKQRQMAGGMPGSRNDDEPFLEHHGLPALDDPLDGKTGVRLV